MKGEILVESRSQVEIQSFLSKLTDGKAVMFPFEGAGKKANTVENAFKKLRKK